MARKASNVIAVKASNGSEISLPIFVRTSEWTTEQLRSVVRNGYMSVLRSGAQRAYSVFEERETLRRNLITAGSSLKPKQLEDLLAKMGFSLTDSGEVVLTIAFGADGAEAEVKRVDLSQCEPDEVEEESDGEVEEMDEEPEA